jgi:general secretion pathway protein B
MSYILDALKKLEHEKSKKTRRDGVINISGALFEHERPRISEPTGRKTLFSVIIAVLVTFGVTWLLLRPAKNRENPVPRLAASLPPTPQAKIETAPAPVAPSVVPGSPTLATPSSEKIPTSKPPVKDLKPQAVVVSTAVEDTVSPLTMPVIRNRLKERKIQTPSPDQIVAAPSDITLSGIAWQEERRARRAVVNGFLMQEGAVVSGARITDIYQDRVRFSLSGKIFEIPLVSSATSNMGR